MVGSKPENKAGGNPPYTYRLFWAIVLLAGNFLVAFYYFKGIS
ncbi:MAG: photosystem I protein PsaX [Microcoleaceae cyanobacterium]